MSQPDPYGDSTELSPSQAFRPRNPGVVRTPPAGSTIPAQPTPARHTPQAPVEEMEVDQPDAGPSIARGTPPRTRPPAEVKTPGRQPTAGPSQDVARTPRSTRKNRPDLPKADDPGMDLEPADMSIEEEGEYGRRWRKTLETLELATKAAAQKWTAKDLKACFPTLAVEDPGEMDGIWLQAATTMKERLMELGMDVMKHYKVPSSLQQIDEVVKEGEAYAELHRKDKGGRADAWRPDTTPEVLTAATQLPMYDEAHTRIREEYLVLHEDCTSRYLSILEKHAQLTELENGVAEGVADLEKTIQLLDGFPNEEMMVWMEESSGMMGGARDQ